MDIREKHLEMKDLHESIRKDLWSKVACAYVNSSNSTTSEYACGWADKVLSGFDERFPKPE